MKRFLKTEYYMVNGITEFSAWVSVYDEDYRLRRSFHCGYHTYDWQAQTAIDDAVRNMTDVLGTADIEVVVTHRGATV